mgnify:FL=1
MAVNFDDFYFEDEYLNDVVMSYISVMKMGNEDDGDKYVTAYIVLRALTMYLGKDRDFIDFALDLVKHKNPPNHNGDH